MSIISFSIFLASLTCSLPARAAAPGTGAATNPCSSIKFNYIEIIESQGPFGAKTPKSDPVVIQNAIALGIANANAIEAATPGAGADYFQLYSYCSLLLKANLAKLNRPLQELTIVCQGDTSEGQVEANCIVAKDISSLDASSSYLDILRYKIASGYYMHNLEANEDRYVLINQPQTRAAYYAEAIRSLVNEEVEKVNRLGGYVNLDRIQ